MKPEITVGVDIGTTSVKAIAADADGNVVARSRVPHRLVVPAPDRLEHDAAQAWRRGPRRALAALGPAARDARAVSVAAMVPSLTAVDRRGIPRTSGLLYGDARGRDHDVHGDVPETGELVAFLRWTHEREPDACGFWPAQSVANHALGGEAILDTSTASTAYPLFDWTGWDEKVAAELGITVGHLPRLVPTAWAAGRVGGDGPVLASGCIDALAEQLVAGADHDGDVLVILGTTLIVWSVVPEQPRPRAAPGYYAIPHTAAGKLLIGGPSNAGGLFVNWALGSLTPARTAADPHRVPVWAPYPRGERSPMRDPDRRAVLADLDLTHDAAAHRRAVFEASGFAARRAIEAAGDGARRVVATGGGVRVDEWVQVLADATGLPVECVAVPEGGALGSAFLARVAAGLEGSMIDGGRWARVERVVEPDARWAAPMEERYRRFLELS